MFKNRCAGSPPTLGPGILILWAEEGEGCWDDAAGCRSWEAGPCAAGLLPACASRSAPLVQCNLSLPGEGQRKCMKFCIGFLINSKRESLFQLCNELYFGGLALLASVLYTHLNSRESKETLIKSLIPVRHTDDNSLLCFPLAPGSCLFSKYPICSAGKIHFSFLGACVRQRNLNKEELVSLISFLLLYRSPCLFVCISCSLLSNISILD